MTNSEPEPDPDNPLSPYYPSETPRIPGNGRTWFALLVVGTMVLVTIAWAISLVI